MSNLNYTSKLYLWTSNIVTKTTSSRIFWTISSNCDIHSIVTKTTCPPPRQQSVFCSLIFFAFPRFFGAVKATSTIGFVLTLIGVFFSAVIYLWICYCSCFFDGLLIGLLNLLRFLALLAPLSRLHNSWCAIPNRLNLRPLSLVFIPKIYKAASFIWYISFYARFVLA